jgi:tetratricopeptide (TPR) repeat protein/peptidoglycan/xylan/chitin deacetylase (PgdA/CDA1 family)
MKRRCQVLLAMALAIVSCPDLSAQENPVASVPSLQSEAIALYRAKRYTEAVPLYRRLASETPDNPDVLQDLMWTLWFAEHYEETRTAAIHLTQLRPNDAQAWALLGRAEHLLGHRAEALADFEQSLSLDSDQTTLMLDIGREQLYFRHYDDAIQILTELLNKQPDMTPALPDLAKALFLAGRFAEAAGMWSKAAAAFPEKTDYKFQEAHALYFAGKQSQALTKMAGILEKDPGHILSINFLIDTALARGDTTAAQAVLEHYLKEPTPSDEPRFLRLAAIYQTANDFQGCVRTLDRLLAGNPKNGQALLMQADCLRDQGRLGDAETIYARVLLFNSWSFRALRSLADLHYAQGRPGDALPYIRRARAMDPTDPYMLFLEANYLYAHGQKPQSDALLRKWLDANPGPSLSVLLYHGLTPYPQDPMLAYPIHYSVAAFEDHMRAIQQAGFHPITAQEAQAWLQGKAILPPRPILITFDDARLDSFRYGDPVLKKYGLKATMMVALANVERNLPGFASWSQLKAYQATGRWEMQAHGNLGHSKIPMDEEGHVGLYMPTKRWLDTEHRLETTAEWETRTIQDMSETSQALQSRLGVNAVAFAFPEGDYGQDNIYNFAQGPALILKHSRELYGSLYHQDSYGFNVQTRDPSFLCRIEANPHWKGRDLIRQLTDRDPVIIAKRTLLRQALWEGRIHEAREWLEQLKRTGCSPAVLFADEARIRSVVGDRPRAWDLAVRALAVDPKDRDNQYLVQTLQEDKHFEWEPRFEYFRDNRDRQNWIFHQQLDTLRTGLIRWSISHLHGFFSESGLPQVTDDGGGLGFSRSLGLYNNLAVRAEGHLLSDPGQNTFSLRSDLHTHWTDYLESDFILARDPYPTARALGAHVIEQALELRTDWSPEGPWKSLADGKVTGLSDHNRRYGGYLEISRDLGAHSIGLRGVYRFTADQTDQVSPNYYSPQQLQLHQMGLAYEAPWGGQTVKLHLRYLPGYGDEKGVHGDFVQVADVDLALNWGKTYSLRPSFSLTSTPTYNSTSYSLTFVCRFY